jgi:hypothetical protein
MTNLNDIDASLQQIKFSKKEFDEIKKNEGKKYFDVNFYDELESDLKLVFNPFGESSREPIDIKHSKLFTLFFSKTYSLT